MQSPFTTWLMVLGMAIAATGCSTFESASGKSTVGPSDHHWLKRAPALTVSGDGVMQAAPLTNSPTESVKSTITDLLFILGNEELKQPGRSEERRQQIEQVVRHRVNYGHMAQRALGTPWAGLDGTEREEFVRLFVQLLRDTCANKIDEYYDEQVFYLGEQRQGRFGEVRTNLVGSKVDTSLIFRLENHSGNWLVYDVVIDGASIVSNYEHSLAVLSKKIPMPAFWKE
jgi:phospholipid transport system substrate-binding protein